MKQQLFVICHNIRSAHNVGAIFRTADAMAITKIYLCGISPIPPRSDISKVALGAEQNVPYEYHRQTMRILKKLKHAGRQLIALENNISTAIDIKKIQLSWPVVLIVGNEVDGLPARILAIADTVVAIPMLGQKRSLNVSVAFGIAAYAFRQRI